MRLGGRHWRRLDDVRRKAWKSRASFLNALTPPGVFHYIPDGVSDCTSLDLRSLTNKLNDLRKVFRLALKCQPERKVSELVLVFGCEKNFVRTQSFCNFSIFIFLQNLVFGSNFNLVRKDKILYKKKNTTVL